MGFDLRYARLLERTATSPASTITVRLLGSEDLDVTEVDLDSLQFHGAKPLSTSIRDVNGDGKPDLMVVFDRKSIKLSTRAKSGRLTGWLKDSRIIIGEDKVRIVPNLAGEDPSCP